MSKNRKPTPKPRAAARRTVALPPGLAEEIRRVARTAREGGPPTEAPALHLLREALELVRHRCEVPGCSSRWGLDIYPIVPRSQGGAFELANLVVLCPGHHEMHALKGTIRVTGDTVASRIWELGIDESGTPWSVYRDEQLIGGAALHGDEEEDDDFNAWVAEAARFARARPDVEAGPVAAPTRVVDPGASDSPGVSSSETTH